MFRFFENLVDPYVVYEEKDAPPQRLLPFLMEYSRPFRGVFMVTAALKCVSAALDVALIWYVGRMVDLLSQGAPADVMKTHGTEFAIAALVVLFVRPIVSGIDVALLHNTILVNYGALFRWRAIRHVLRQSVGWFENDFAGRIATKIMQGGEAVGDFIVNIMATMWSFLTFVVLAVIMIFVIPAFKEVFSSFGADLPAPTLFVIALSEFFVKWWWAIFSAIGGGLISPSGANYYGPETYQQIGTLVDTGTSGCTSGFCPPDPSTTLASFDGVFVHPGSANPTSVVFRADSAMTVTKLDLLSETVGNGNLGNGFDVSVRSYTGGSYHSIGSFGFSYGTTLTSFNQTIYNSPVALSAGEFIEISYGNAGNYGYDHGNINVTVTTGAVTATAPFRWICPRSRSWPRTDKCRSSRCRP